MMRGFFPAQNSTRDYKRMLASAYPLSMPRFAQPYRMVNVLHHPYRPGVYRKAIDRLVLFAGDLIFRGADALAYIVAKQAGMPVGRFPVSRSCRQITNDVFCEMANDLWRGVCGTLQLARQYPDYAAFAAGVALLFFGGMTPAEWAYQIARSAFLTQLARNAPWWARPIFSAAGY
jgi:hypothetical protein